MLISSFSAESIESLFSILGISIIGIVLALIKGFKNRQCISDIVRELLSRKVKILHNYYDTEFLVKRIKKAKKLVRIFCVRNIRVSEPDIIKALRTFCMSNSNKIEIFAINPDAEDAIIEKIMITLPIEPESVAGFRAAVKENKKVYQRLNSDLGSNSNMLGYYEYSVLPTMHFCQFDNTIYLGFQVFDDKDDRNSQSLLDYCIVVKARSKLGKMLSYQVDYLIDKKELCQKVDLSL